MHGHKFGIFVDDRDGTSRLVFDGAGFPLVFRSERSAQEALAGLAMAKLRSFMRSEIDFDDALCTIKEYYAPIRFNADGSVSVVCDHEEVRDSGTNLASVLESRSD